MFDTNFGIDVDQEIAKNDSVIERVKALERINYSVAELQRIKEALEEQVRELLGHDEEGQKTYLLGRYKVTVKTGVNYSLNKDEFEAIGSRLPADLQPVQKVMKYELNKKIIRQAYIYGSAEDKAVLDAIIVARPAKLNIAIGSAS